MLICEHRAFGLRDHEQAWNVDTSKSKKNEGKLLPWRPSVASSWAQRVKVSPPKTKIGSFVTALSFSDRRSTRTFFCVSSLHRNQAMGVVPGDCICIYPEPRQEMLTQSGTKWTLCIFESSCDWNQRKRLIFSLGMGIWRRWERCLRRGWWRCL